MSMNALGRAVRIPAAGMIYHCGKPKELLAEIVVEHPQGLNLVICIASDASVRQPPTVRLEAMIAAMLDSMAKRPRAHTLMVHGLCALTRLDQSDVRVRIGLILDTLSEPMRAVELAEGDQPGLARGRIATVFAGAWDALAGAGWQGVDRDGFARSLPAMLVAERTTRAWLPGNPKTRPQRAAVSTGSR